MKILNYFGTAVLALGLASIPALAQTQPSQQDPSQQPPNHSRARHLQAAVTRCRNRKHLLELS